MPALDSPLQGPDEHPSLDSDPPQVACRNLADSFVKWRDLARSRRRLITLANSFQARRSSGVFSNPSANQVSPFAFRLAAQPASPPVFLNTPDDVSKPVSQSPEVRTSPPEVRISLPFFEAANLPLALASHKDRAIITRVLSSRIDRTLKRWRRRALYTAENWADWAEWSRPGHTHRDRLESGSVFLDKNRILTAPKLRSPDIETAADAWNIYRRELLIFIRQALTVGFPWSEILVRLITIFEDADSGYPRLVNHLTAALEDVLLDYPLLHADVLFYKIDKSYANGTRKYSADSASVEWERAISRDHGEDPITLAIRVTNAFLMKHDSAMITDVTVWDHTAFANEINNRYFECLLNDLADPNWGYCISEYFLNEWLRIQALHEHDPVEMPSINLSCEFIAKLTVAPHESAVRPASSPTIAAVEPQGVLALTDCSHRSRPTMGGRGARARRDAARAVDRLHPTGIHSAEPPPSAYHLDLLPEQL